MKHRKECRKDLRVLRDEIAKVTNEYEDGSGDDTYSSFRVGDGENDEVAALDAEVLRLRNEYLESRRNRALAKGQGSVEGR
jgi:hypothetical protein